jgi:hypothetical protein
MKYLILEGSSAEELQAKVQHYIGEGWEPLGGVSAAASPNTGSWWYYQAMVMR